MNQFMVTIIFNSYFSEEFVALIPDQRAQVSDLLEKGTVTGYSLSLDRRTLWMTLYADSYGDVEDVLKSMPLFKFMRYEINELMFHNNSVHTPIQFSLN